MTGTVLGSWRFRGLQVLVVLAASLGGSHVAGASAAPGDLTQKPGDLGCVSVMGVCGPGIGLDGATRVIVSPDGTSVYSLAVTGDALGIFDRAADGSLAQKPGEAGCIGFGPNAPAPCADGGPGLDNPGNLAVSPDSANVYLTISNMVVVYDRAADGSLTRKEGEAGCISDSGAPPCADAAALDGPNSVAFGPDGTTAYVSASASDAVAVFDRAADGTLTQKAGTAGCISDGGAPPCANTLVLDGPGSLVVKPDGASIYVKSSHAGGAVVALDRAANGTLSQPPGGVACAAPGPAPPCTADANAIEGGSTMAVSADGANLYISNLTSHSVAVFDTATNGTLTQKLGAPGCVSQSGDAPCATGRSLDGTRSLALTPDDGNLYVIGSFNAGGLALFDRGTGGALFQKTDTSGCIRDIESFNLLGCAAATSLNGPIGIAVSPDSANVYVATGASDSITIFDRELPPDTTPPETTIDSGPSGPTSDPNPTFGFSSSEPGSSFDCRLDGPGGASTGYLPCTSPRTYTGLADGDYTLRVRATDPAINPDPTPATRSFTLDSPPQTTINSGPGALTNDDGPAFGFSASQSGSSFECRLDGPGANTGVFDPCESPHAYSSLPDGAYSLQVQAADSTGNVDPTPASRAFRVDTVVAGALVTAAKNQKVNTGRRGRMIQVKVKARAQEPHTVSATGTITVSKPKRSSRLKTVRRASGGGTTLLRLRPSKLQRKFAKALNQGRKVVARLAVELTDDAGNRVEVTRKVRLRR